MKKIDYISLFFIGINIFILFIREPSCDSGACAYLYVMFALPSFFIAIFFYLLFRKLDSGSQEENISSNTDLNEYGIIKNERKRKIVYWILNLNLLLRIFIFLVSKISDLDIDLLISDSFLVIPYALSTILLLPWLIIPAEFIRLKNIQGNLLRVKSFIKIISYILFFAVWIYYTFVIWVTL